MFLIPVGSRGRCHIGADKAVPPQHTQREPGPNKGRGGHGETDTADVTNNTSTHAST